MEAPGIKSGIKKSEYVRSINIFCKINDLCTSKVTRNRLEYLGVDRTMSDTKFELYTLNVICNIEKELYSKCTYKQLRKMSKDGTKLRYEIMKSIDLIYDDIKDMSYLQQEEYIDRKLLDKFKKGSW